MFKLLSKESNIFSIPLYIIFLLVIILVINILNYSIIDFISALILFCGISLGFFAIISIGLNKQSHLPLFLYTFMVIAFFPGTVDIGLSISIITNSFLLLLFTNPEENYLNNKFVLIGSVLAINYIFLPVIWPLLPFVILHIIATTNQIFRNIFRLFFGITLIIISYFSIVYFLDFNSWDIQYFPFGEFKINKDNNQLLYLFPISLLLLLAVFDHFYHFSQKSPINRYKYTFILVFSVSQLSTIILYMGNSYEFLLLLAIPASIILSRYLWYFKKLWLKEITLWMIILSLIGYKISEYINLF